MTYCEHEHKSHCHAGRVQIQYAGEDAMWRLESCCKELTKSNAAYLTSVFTSFLAWMFYVSWENCCLRSDAVTSADTAWLINLRWCRNCMLGRSHQCMRCAVSQGLILEFGAKLKIVISFCCSPMLRMSFITFSSRASTIMKLTENRWEVTDQSSLHAVFLRRELKLLHLWMLLRKL